MILSIVREHHWNPEIIKDLYHDNEDYHGIEFWYNDVLAINSKLKSDREKIKPRK